MRIIVSIASGSVISLHLGYGCSRL